MMVQMFEIQRFRLFWVWWFGTFWDWWFRLLQVRRFWSFQVQWFRLFKAWWFRLPQVRVFWFFQVWLFRVFQARSFRFFLKSDGSNNFNSVSSVSNNLVQNGFKMVAPSPLQTLIQSSSNFNQMILRLGITKVIKRFFHIHNQCKDAIQDVGLWLSNAVLYWHKMWWVGLRLHPKRPLEVVGHSTTRWLYN